MEKLEKKILKTISDYFKNKGIEFENDKFESIYFLDEGWIDSFELIEFIIFLEDTFNINLNPEELQSEKFRQIGGLKEIILRKIISGEAD